MSQAFILDPRTRLAVREFERWSERYDQCYLQNLFFKPTHDLLLSLVGSRDRRVLDVGCGTGIFATRLLERHPNTNVWGLDLSEAMLRQASARVFASRGRLHLMHGDSASLPFQAHSFDVVTCSHSFHHYPDQERAIAEMRRVLRPGGRLLIADGDRDGLWGRLVFDGLVTLKEWSVWHRSRADMRELYYRAGFTDVVQLRRRQLLPFLLTVGVATSTLAA